VSFINKKNTLKDYITGLAVSSGFGIRFDTPVGPLRLDVAWPVYYPSSIENKTIFTRPDGLTNAQFHIALGHSF
jgi:outer membrane translocation and assembly module TamA